MIRTVSRTSTSDPERRRDNLSPRPNQRRTQMAATTRQQTDPTIAELVKSASADVSTLVTDQIELTKAEVKASAQKAGNAFGLLAGAAFVGVLFLVFLLVTLAYVLVALGLPVWAGFGIVTLLLLIIAAVLGLLGKKHASQVKGPERAMAQIEATKSAFTSS